MKTLKETMRENVEVVIRFVKGMIVGAGTITAGAGTFAILLGIYDRCMEIIAKPFKNFKDNLIYMLPILLGIGVSFLVLKDPVAYAFNYYPAYIKCFFFSIILGGIPTLRKQADKQGKSNRHLIALLGALLLTLISTYFADSFVKSTGGVPRMEFINLIIYGIIYGFGAIMPGMTTLHILIFLGVSGPIMTAITTLDIQMLIPFVIGYLSVVLLVANLMTLLFRKFYGYTYYAIIGFSITSLVMLIPTEIDTTMEYILCPIILIGTTFAMYYISRAEHKLSTKIKNDT